MKKIIILLTASIFVLVGCTSSTEAVSTPCESVDGTYEITLVTDAGGINDKSFNQGSWEGVEAYCTDNETVDAQYIETAESAQIETNLKTASEQSEVVIATGYNFSTPVYNVAPLYPDVNYIMIDAEPVDAEGNPVSMPNVMSYYFAEEQAGYLVGYVAGKMTKTNQIGFIGGEAVSTVSRFAYGYIQGAYAANPNIVVSVQYADTFVDQTKGQTMANTMYGNGCDIIFSAAGVTGVGVINAAITQNQEGNVVWAIGVDIDQYSEGIYTNSEGVETSAVLTSAVKNVSKASYAGLDAHFSGTWAGGSVTTLTIDDGGVGFPTENPNVDPALITEASDALTANKDSIANTLEGTIASVPTEVISGELK